MRPAGRRSTARRPAPLLASALLGVCLALLSAGRTRAVLLTYKDLLARKPARADQRIAYGPGPAQFGELWLPRGPARPAVAVIVHGGCWRSDLPGLELMNLAAADLRRRGFAVWNIEYRRLGETGGGYPGTFLDVGAAIDHLRVLARDHHLDLGRVVVIGHSAGGHLALWAAGRSKLPGWSGLKTPRPLRIAGVVTLAGIDDLEAYQADGPDACGGPSTIEALVGADRRQGQGVFDDTSPPRLAPLGVRQIIVSGELDPIVPARFGAAYAAQARGAGDAVKVLVEPGAGHFELIDPASPAWPPIARAARRLARGSWDAIGP